MPEPSGRLTFTRARPVDPLYVDVDGKYGSKRPRVVRRATDVDPDASPSTRARWRRAAP